MAAQAARKSHPRTPPFLVGKVDPAAPAVEEKSNHYGNLESQIADLYRAADLAATLLEDTLESQRLSPDSDLVRLPTAFTERLLFTAFEVEKRVSALRDFCHDPKNGVFG
jgi:hypothetical protein